MTPHLQDPFFEAVGQRIKELRETKNENQDMLADYMKVPRSTVAKWETGRQNFKSKEILKIADYFQTSTDYLLRGISTESTGSLDIYATTGLTDAAIQSLADEKNASDFLFDNGRIPLVNELLSDKNFYALLEKYVHFRAEWKILQKESKAEKKQETDGTNQDEYAMTTEEKSAFLKWKFFQDAEQYFMDKIDK